MTVVRRAALPVLLAAFAVLAGAAALRGPRGTGRSSVAPAVPAAPVLSPRRVPALLRRLVADQHLRSALDGLLAPWPSSCLAVAQGARPLYSVRADLPFVPASNMKILTATAAAATLGADSRFTTEARLAGSTLWLVGGGDPLLRTADFVAWQRRLAPQRTEPDVYTPFEELADRIKAAGVTSVTGGVMGDESRYDTQRYIPTWQPVYITDGDVGPASALDVNQGFVQFTPKQVGAPAPAQHAADVLVSLLVARGVNVTGGIGFGTVPAGSRFVAKLDSPPIGAEIGEMLRESDNLTAELLIKEMGRRAGKGGSTAAGIEVMRRALADAGLAVDQLTTVDGSGLDRSDRATCGLLRTAIDHAAVSGPVVAGLPVAGREGTLAKRLTGTPAAGRVRAKTGSLAGVSALTGVVDTSGGTPITFSLILNGLPRADRIGRGVADEVAGALARYPEAPALAELSP